MKQTIKNNAKPIGFVFLSVVVFALVYFNKDKLVAFFSRAKGGGSAVLNSSTENTPLTNTPISLSSGVATDDTILKIGSPHRDKVRVLQELINERKIGKIVSAKLSVDGVFGTQTEAVLDMLTGMKAISINQFKQLVKA